MPCSSHFNLEAVCQQGAPLEFKKVRNAISKHHQFTVKHCPLRHVTVEIAVQINGKVKATLKVGLDEDEASVKEKAHAIPVIEDLTVGKNIVKEIYVKGRILNIVAK